MKDMLNGGINTFDSLAVAFSNTDKANTIVSDYLSKEKEARDEDLDFDLVEYVFNFVNDIKRDQDDYFHFDQLLEDYQREYEQCSIFTDGFDSLSDSAKYELAIASLVYNRLEKLGL